MGEHLFHLLVVDIFWQVHHDGLELKRLEEEFIFMTSPRLGPSFVRSTIHKSAGIGADTGFSWSLARKVIYRYLRPRFSNVAASAEKKRGIRVASGMETDS